MKNEKKMKKSTITSSFGASKIILNTGAVWRVCVTMEIVSLDSILNEKKGIVSPPVN